MAMQSVWGKSLADFGDKSWAEDAMDEEAEHGQIAAPEAKIQTPAPDDAEFPALGMEGPSKAGGGKKGKRVKGKKLALDEFNSMGGGALDERAKILNSLPKNALGADAPDPRSFRGGGNFRRHDEEPSKADGSSNWGADRRTAPPPRAGGFGGGGGGGFGGGGGGFSRADEDGAWARGGGVGAPPANRARNGFGGMGRADEDGAWSRGTARGTQPPPPARSGWGGGGMSRADEDSQWSRGQRLAPPPGRHDGVPPVSRADDDAVWARGQNLQPAAARGPEGPGRSHADESSSWTRREGRAPPPLGHHREPAASDTNDNWSRGKAGPPPRRTGSSGAFVNSPRNSPRTSVAGSDRDFDSPRHSSHRSPADEAQTWSRGTATVPARKPHPTQGRWGKQEAPAHAEPKEPPRERESKFGKTAPATPAVEEDPGDEELALQQKLQELQLRKDAGEGDADSQDVGENGELLNIEQAHAACQCQLEALANARKMKAQEGTPDAPRWGRAPREEPEASTKASETMEDLENSESHQGDADDEGFSEVVSRSTAKKQAQAAKSTQPSGRSSARGGSVQSPQAPPRKGGAPW